MRRSMTPFGSGWDPLRQLTQEAGTTFEKFVRTPAFKQSLTRGRFVRSLGQGSFGDVSLMESVVRVGEKEHSFQYAAKTMKESRYTATFREVKAQRKLQDLNAPNLYGWKKNTVFMEAFHGRGASEVMRKGQQLPESFIKDMENFVPEMHKRGIAHRDIARDVGVFIKDEDRIYTGELLPHNIIVTKEGRAGVIDYGLAIKPGESTAESKMYQRGFSGTTFRRNENLDMALVKSLRANQGQLSELGSRALGIEVGKAASIESASISIPTKATAAASGNTDKMRKLAMAASQKNTARAMSENARSGGRRSKASFANTRKTI